MSPLTAPEIFSKAKELYRISVSVYYYKLVAAVC